MYNPARNREIEKEVHRYGAQVHQIIERVLLCLFFARSPLIAQDQQIGIIDFYGLHTISESDVRAVLVIKEGDTLPHSTSDIVKRVQGMPNVARAHVEVVCCDAGKLIVYVGIEEKDMSHFEYQITPLSDIVLPEEITKTYQSFLIALKDAVRKGDTKDDVSQGHSFMANPFARSLQERFVAYAHQHLQILRDVLRNSANVEQREIAAYVIAYASNKRLVIDDLLYATHDADNAVRNNATRALGAIAQLAEQKPELGIKIPAAPFINMLNSLVWTDRNKAVMVLTALTKRRDAPVLQQLREQALPSLAEMARWKSAGHALGAYIILGRVAGLSENQIGATWTTNMKDSVIANVIKASQTK